MKKILIISTTMIMILSLVIACSSNINRKIASEEPSVQDSKDYKMKHLGIKHKYQKDKN